jgi:hypothetical protein
MIRSRTSTPFLLLLFVLFLLDNQSIAKVEEDEECLPPAPKTKVEPKEGPGAADIMFVVDTSGSMGSEAANVASNLNAFGQHLEKEGIDYHLIVVAQDMSSVRLCVKKPVAKTDCGLTGDRFLKTNTYIASTDACTKMVDPNVYKAYSAMLRQDSGKTIVFVSDDTISGTFGCTSSNCKTPAAKNFLTKLQEIDTEGYFKPTSKLLNGVMVHSIDAHDCGGEPGNGRSFTYKGLAEQTGGTNFKLCETDWTPYFSTIAGAVGSTTVGSKCKHGIPRSSTNPALLVGNLEPDTPFDVTFEYGTPTTMMTFKPSPTNTCQEQGCTYSGHSCVCDLRCPKGLSRTGDGSECGGSGAASTCSLGYCHKHNPNNLPECTLDPQSELLYVVDDTSSPTRADFCRQTCSVLRDVSGDAGGDVSFSFKPVAKLKSITVGGRNFGNAANLFGPPKQFHPAHSFPTGHPYTSRTDCGGTPQRPTVPVTGPSLFSSGGSCTVATGAELFYALDPSTGRSRTFLTGAGLMIFFFVNSMGESFLGVQVGHKETISGAPPKSGYAVLDLVLSGSKINTMAVKPDWIFQDNAGGSNFNKWKKDKASGRVLLSNKDGQTAGGILGPLPAYDFCLDLVIVEASGAVNSVSIVNFDADFSSPNPSVPTQIKLGGEFLEEGGMRFCADSCDGQTRTDLQTDHSVDCWTDKSTQVTLCPDRKPGTGPGFSDPETNNGSDEPSNGTKVGDDAYGGGGVAGILLLLLLCCCCCIGGMYYINEKKKKEGSSLMMMMKKKHEQRKKKSKKNKGANNKDVEMSDLPPNWKDWKETIDEESGYPVYTNSKTGEVTWDKPTKEMVTNMINPMKRGAHNRNETQLPSGWGKDMDGEGNKFYYSADGEVQWDAPEGSVGGSAGSAGGAGGVAAAGGGVLLSSTHCRSDTELPEGWGKDTDQEGNKYYYSETGETSWTAPPGSTKDGIDHPDIQL